jgi:hypothetical protein
LLNYNDYNDNGWGGNAYRKWIEFVFDVSKCYDFEKKHWLFLPEIGGYYNQDEFIMDIWNVVVNEFERAYCDSAVVSELNRIKG